MHIVQSFIVFKFELDESALIIYSMRTHVLCPLQTYDSLHYNEPSSFFLCFVERYADSGESSNTQNTLIWTKSVMWE